MHQIERIVQSAAPDPELVVIGGWPMAGSVGYGVSVLVNAPLPGLGSASGRYLLENEFAEMQITPRELDRISSGRAVVIAIAGGGVMNTMASEMARKHFPPGRIPILSALGVLLPQPPPEVLAPLFKRELEEHVAPDGYTTVSSRFGDNEIATLGVLDQAGELPVRVGFAQQVEPMPLEEFDRFVQHLKEVENKYNSERLWMTGLTGVPLDGSPDAGGICSSFTRLEGLNKAYPFDSTLCYDWDQTGDVRLEILRRLNRLGYRFSNMHSWGNLALENALEFYLELDRDRPLKGRRFAFDHTALLSPKVIDLSKQFGIYWSVIPTAFATQRGELMRQAFGDEMANAWGAPVKKLVDAGLRVSFEGEFWAADPWKGLQVLVTRMDDAGKVQGTQNTVDRPTALRIMTRWGAEYVLREKEIGSIEPGKFADLIVVDKNPLDPHEVPDEQLATIRTLLTMVGGKVVFRHTSFEL